MSIDDFKTIHPFNENALLKTIANRPVCTSIYTFSKVC